MAGADDVLGVGEEETAHGGGGGVVLAAGAVVHGLLLQQLHDGLEAVGVWAEEVGVEGVEPGHLLGGVQTLVADEATDQGPVLLLDVGVVVLVEGA